MGKTMLQARGNERLLEATPQTYVRPSVELSHPIVPWIPRRPSGTRLSIQVASIVVVIHTVHVPAIYPSSPDSGGGCAV